MYPQETKGDISPEIPYHRNTNKLKNNLNRSTSPILTTADNLKNVEQIEKDAKYVNEYAKYQQEQYSQNEQKKINVSKLSHLLK